MHELTNLHPVVYVSYANGIMTTGAYVLKNDDGNVFDQLQHEIQKFEGEEAVRIMPDADKWNVYVTGRFAPIGHVYALAMLDPDWRP